MQCGDISFAFAASVLWLQGPKICTQPLESDNSVFVYNGDVFGGTAIKHSEIQENGDTFHFCKGLECHENIFEFLEKLEGPYAFVYLDKRKKKLLFGRDSFGRRSLLLGKSNETIVLCSVAKRNKDLKFIEVPAIGIFCYDLTTHSLKLFAWQHKNQNFNSKLKEIEHFLHVNIEVQNSQKAGDNKKFQQPTNLEINKILDLATSDTSVFAKLLNDRKWMENVTHLKQLLEISIKNRIATQPQLCNACILPKTPCTHAVTGVLFSGGVDCAILSLLADKYTESHRPIDLINVAFDEARNYQTPDRLTGLQTLKELKRLRPEREWNFLEVNVTQDELNEKRTGHIADLIYPLNSVLDDSLGCALWFASRGLKDDHYKSPCRVNF